LLSNEVGKMSSVGGAMTQIALTQAQVQNQIAVHLMKVARETGTEQQMLELVEQTAQAAAQTAAGAAVAGLDVYA
jgi:hypothetical protein